MSTIDAILFTLRDGSTIALTPERYQLAQQLAEHPWWHETAAEMQRELLSLPEDDAKRNNWNGFIHAAATHSDSGGGVTLVRLVEIPRGNFAGILKFAVVNAAGTEYTYEFISWKFGSESGVKGAVFVRTGDEITHFILLRGFRFSTGQVEWGSVGGFAEMNTDGVRSIMDRVIVELREELNVPDLTVSSLELLGPVAPDHGMTNNEPLAFAAVIDSSDAARLSSTPVAVDELELEAGAEMFPIAMLGDMAMLVKESFFHVAVTRAIHQGIVAHYHLLPQAA
jgi:hypothetical protein